MFEEWINQHPWMTFFLGLMSLSTLNVFFISLGGGYKKFPPHEKNEHNGSWHKEILND